MGLGRWGENIIIHGAPADDRRPECRPHLQDGRVGYAYRKTLYAHYEPIYGSPGVLVAIPVVPRVAGIRWLILPAGRSAEVAMGEEGRCHEGETGNNLHADARASPNVPRKEEGGRGEKEYGHGGTPAHPLTEATQSARCRI